MSVLSAVWSAATSLQLVPNTGNVAKKSWSAWLILISGTLMTLGQGLQYFPTPWYVPVGVLAVAYAARFIAQKGKGFSIPDATTADPDYSDAA